MIRFRALVSHRAEVEVTRNLKLDRKTTISSFCKLKSADGPMLIGRDTDIATGCFLSSGSAGIEIGSKVLVGPNTAIVGINYDYSDVGTAFADLPKISKGIRIENNVWIGANSSILDGADIGEGSIIVANSTVSGKVAPRSIVAGNPAEVLFKRR